MGAHARLVDFPDPLVLFSANLFHAVLYHLGQNPVRYQGRDDGVFRDVTEVDTQRDQGGEHHVQHVGDVFVFQFPPSSVYGYGVHACKCFQDLGSTEWHDVLQFFKGSSCGLASVLDFFPFVHGTEEFFLQQLEVWIDLHGFQVVIHRSYDDVVSVRCIVVRRVRFDDVFHRTCRIHHVQHVGRACVFQRVRLGSGAKDRFSSSIFFDHEPIPHQLFQMLFF
mmetsp:Transcript_442/g.1600  ORF Transcript_442/g.1600 Transcript_442/m.1600 type:complete len:222 (-) Transcript_442:130-795(-)